MKRLGFAVLAALALSAGGADAYAARNGFQVQRLSDGNFQVMSRGGLSAPRPGVRRAITRWRCWG